MQVGYSIKLGETIAAAEAEYDDCAMFQITCPACREAVFKGMRNIPRAIHYFSHYRAVDDARLCELRVGHIAKQMGVVDGFVGHEQTLQKFMATFRESLIAGYERATGYNLRRETMKIYVQPYMDPLADDAFKEFYSYLWRERSEGPDVRDDLLRMFKLTSVLKDRSPFWMRRASSYVMDVMRHLDNPQAGSNRRFLLAMAFAAWPHLSPDFVNMIGKSETQRAFVNSIATAQKPSEVRRRADEVTQVNEGYREGYSQGYAEAQAVAKAQLDNVTAIVRRLKGGAAKKQFINSELDRRINLIMALTAMIELTGPLSTLLALGCDG